MLRKHCESIYLNNILFAMRTVEGEMLNVFNKYFKIDQIKYLKDIVRINNVCVCTETDIEAYTSILFKYCVIRL